MADLIGIVWAIFVTWVLLSVLTLAGWALKKVLEKIAGFRWGDEDQ